MLESSVIERILDDHVIPKIKAYVERTTTTTTTSGASSSLRFPPFKLAVTGLQGSGKSTWSDRIAAVLTERGYNARTISLDDLYFDRENLVMVRDSNPQNKLLRTRGLPGTHDTQLARWFFGQFEGSSGGTFMNNGQSHNNNREDDILFPVFDKSKFGGEGDRLLMSEWHRLESNERPLDVLVFEGWCVGFRPLSESDVAERWKEALLESSKGEREKENSDTRRFSTTTLGDHDLEHLKHVNSNLASYCDAFMGPGHLDYLIHLDTDDLVNVYHWRMEQEAKLRHTKGTGMSDNDVVAFVKGYMPAYELYLDGLRGGFFGKPHNGKHLRGQLRVVLDKQRNIAKILQA